jgi:hypothetical protein
MLADLAPTLQRLTADVAGLIDAATPKPSDEQSPRGTAEVIAQVRASREALEQAAEAWKSLGEALLNLQAIALSKAAAKRSSKPAAAKKATARKR